VDGRALTFLTPNRPARRYLYLRYVITYLHYQKLGDTARIEAVDAKGFLWATPGPYLRRTMLLSLARKISDRFLPEAFYETTTFTEADGCDERTAEQEADLVMALTHKMNDSLHHEDEDGDEEEHEEHDDEEGQDDDKAGH
jgi:hypothetical protein